MNPWNLRLVGFVDHSSGAHAGAAGMLGAVVSYYWAYLEYGRELAVVRYVLLIGGSGGRTVGIWFLCFAFGIDNMRMVLLEERYPGKHGFGGTVHGAGAGAHGFRMGRSLADAS
jgi:hypothetical protein